jgi:hypothetical protein
VQDNAKEANMTVIDLNTALKNGRAERARTVASAWTWMFGRIAR